MDIVYLIGNGFDLKLGLNTSYKDFYKWYEDSSNEIQKPPVLKFIDHIRINEKVDKDWSDMELALGKYTKEFKSEDIIEESKNFHEYLVHAISEFIKLQEAKIPKIDNAEELLCKYLISPEGKDRLLVEENKAFVKYRQKWSNTSPWNINIISFNYTNSIEKLSKFEGGRHIGNYFTNGRESIHLNEIEHIHGFTNDRLILGVNDQSQVENELLHPTNAMNWYVKSQFNSLCKLGHAAKCERWINNANLICVFGFSLGKTDKQWWEFIVKRMLSTNDCWLLLFYYDPNHSFTNLQIPRREEHKSAYKNIFLNSSGIDLTDSQRESLRRRIYISYNSDMFTFEANDQTK